MKKIFFLILLSPATLFAYPYGTKQIFNPCTGCGDFVSTITSNTIQAGTNVAVVNNSSGVVISAGSNLTPAFSALTFSASITWDVSDKPNASILCTSNTNLIPPEKKL
jgi:hypothetical protein